MEGTSNSDSAPACAAELSRSTSPLGAGQFERDGEKRSRAYKEPPGFRADSGGKHRYAKDKERPGFDGGHRGEQQYTMYAPRDAVDLLMASAVSSPRRRRQVGSEVTHSILPATSLTRRTLLAWFTYRPVTWRRIADWSLPRGLRPGRRGEHRPGGRAGRGRRAGRHRRGAGRLCQKLLKMSFNTFANPRLLSQTPPT